MIKRLVNRSVYAVQKRSNSTRSVAQSPGLHRDYLHGKLGGRNGRDKFESGRQLNSMAFMKKGLKIGLAVGMVGLGVRYATDEGMKRSVRFWSVAFPIYLHYRYVQWATKNEPDEVIDVAFNELHDRYAPIAEKLTLEMRGFYLKNAQTVSTADFFLPPQYLEWCKRMQDEVPTEMDEATVRKIIETGLKGKTLEEVFSEFHFEPIGCASIGQVHYAKLRDSGDEVAVKVQAPGIERKFRSDIKTMIDFCKLAMPQHVTPMQEIEKQFATEFDYIGEAKNLELTRANVMPKFHDCVVIPRPYLEYCSKQVLVMEFLHGKSLLKGVKEMLQKYADSQGRSYEEVEEEQKALMRSGQMHLRDIESESRRMKMYQNLVATRAKISNVFRGLYNYTAGLVMPRLEYVKPEEILNLAEIVRIVALVHGHEIMVDGVFNGDPHPGNILLLNDGRIGLVDAGQTKMISPEMRKAYANLIIALADDDKEKVVELLRDLGMTTKYNNPNIQYLMTKFWHDTNSKNVTGGMNIQEFIDYCEAQDPAVQIPADLVMPGRVSVLLRGMGNAFGIDLRMSHLWLPIAKTVANA